MFKEREREFRKSRYLHNMTQYNSNLTITFIIKSNHFTSFSVRKSRLITPSHNDLHDMDRSGHKSCIDCHAFCDFKNQKLIIKLEC